MKRKGVMKTEMIYPHLIDLCCRDFRNVAIFGRNPSREPWDAH
jgi:hypothetical protein